MSSTFEPCGVITITTDFGHKGPFIGTMKGMVLRRFPAARIVDLTHETHVHWPAEAGFWVARAYRYFPAGSVHVAVVDPGVGTERDIVVLIQDGHAFLAPDNGLLAPLAAEADSPTIYRLDSAALADRGIQAARATFHGRDIFAPVAADLASGAVTADVLGPATTELIPSWLEEPVQSSNRITGTVVTVDHFGNLITNIDESLIAKLSDPAVTAGGHRLPFRHTYGESSPGEYLALINSFGVLEIARAEQSAADGLGLGRGAPVTVIEGEH